MSASLLKRLAEAGTPMDLIMEVAETLADAKAAERLLEKRREKDRNRKRNSVESVETTESVESAETPSPLDPPKVSPIPPSNNPPLSPNPKAQPRPCLLKGIGLPKEIPAEPWLAFVRMRKAKDKGFTEDAARGAVRKLLKMAGEGFDPEKLLWRSVDNGWKSFFEHDSCRATTSNAPVDWGKRAEFYEGIGKKAEAEECRRRVSSIGSIANDILREVRTA